MVDPLGETTRASLLGDLKDRKKHQAWLAFDRRYGDLITRYACRCGVSFADADDARQMTFLILLAVMKNFSYDKQRGHFRSYLAMVVRRAIGRCTDPHAQRYLSQTEFDAPIEEQGTDSIWDEEWERMHLRRSMDKVRPTISPASMEVFEDLLRGISVDMIAESRNLSRDAVYKIKRRVRDRLSAEIKTQIAADEEGLESYRYVS